MKRKRGWGKTKQQEKTKILHELYGKSGTYPCFKIYMYSAYVQNSHTCTCTYSKQRNPVISQKSSLYSTGIRTISHNLVGIFNIGSIHGMAFNPQR